jgi:hypothetical protein
MQPFRLKSRSWQSWHYYSFGITAWVGLFLRRSGAWSISKTYKSSLIESHSKFRLPLATLWPWPLFNSNPTLFLDNCHRVLANWRSCHLFRSPQRITFLDYFKYDFSELSWSWVQLDQWHYSTLPGEFSDACNSFPSIQSPPWRGYSLQYCEVNQAESFVSGFDKFIFNFSWWTLSTKSPNDIFSREK